MPANGLLENFKLREKKEGKPAKIIVHKFGYSTYHPFAMPIHESEKKTMRSLLSGHLYTQYVLPVADCQF